MAEASCKDCGATFNQFNTTQNRCFSCVRAKFLQAPQKKRKAVNKIGRVTERWIEYRKDWFERFPPDKDGNYTCGICGDKVPAEETTLDHRLPRSGNPELRFVDSNIVPAHGLCNTMKGSKRL